MHVCVCTRGASLGLFGWDLRAPPPYTHDPKFVFSPGTGSPEEVLWVNKSRFLTYKKNWIYWQARPLDAVTYGKSFAFSASVPVAQSQIVRDALVALYVAVGASKPLKFPLPGFLPVITSPLSCHGGGLRGPWNPWGPIGLGPLKTPPRGGP